MTAGGRAAVPSDVHRTRGRRKELGGERGRTWWWVERELSRDGARAFWELELAQAGR